MLGNNEKRKYRVLILIIILMAYIFGYLISSININVTKNTEIDKNILISKSDYDVASNKVIFSEITTTEEDYYKLKSVCSKAINNNEDIGSTDINTNIKLKDTEIYVDNPNNINIKTKANISYDTHEAYVIYFQDKILATYINELGNMQILTSGYKTRETSELFKKDKVPKSVREGMKVCESYTLDKSSLIFKREYIKNQYKSSFRRAMTEQEYINGVVDILIETMITDTTSNNDIKFRKKALELFTVEAYDNIIYGSDNIGRAEEIDIKVRIVEAGSTKIGGNKDRIFIQLEILQNDRVVITNIIAKFNEYNKVFDIDIL